MMTKEGSIKTVNFIGARVLSHVVKIHNFFKNLLFSQALMGQTKYIVMMTKDVFIKVVSFMTPGAGFPVLGNGHIMKIKFSF